MGGVIYPVHFNYGGMVGVYLLFSITGFLSVIGDKKNASEYCAKRIARLYPSYFASVILTSIVLTLFLPLIKPSAKQVLLNFTMIQKLFGVEGVDGVYWTLSVQLLFYTFIAIVIWKRLYDYLPIIAVGWQSCGLVVSIISKFYDGTLLHMIQLAFVSDYIETLLVGMMMGLIYNEKITIKNKFFWIVFTGGICNQMIAWGWKNTLIYVLVCIMVSIPAMHIDIKESAVSRFFDAAAAISYPYYLVHCKIGYAVLAPLLQAGLVQEYWLLIPAVVTGLLAIVIHKTIEVPGRKLIMRLYHRIQVV